MRVLISGSSGLVGQALFADLKKRKFLPFRLLRRGSKTTPDSNDVIWSPEEGFVERDKMEGFDAIVHLAGESILGRWSSDKKRRIVDSRVAASRFLCSEICKLRRPPKVYLGASAIGYYGDRPNETLEESSPPGQGFLSKVAVDWEKASDGLVEQGIKSCWLRFGVILSPKGGALKSMLLPFKLGLGGRLGTGQQYMSWITLNDVVGAIYHLLLQSEVSGAFNFCTSESVTNSEFTSTLAKVLKRPAFLHVPSFLLNLAFGELSQEILLSSTRTLPRALIRSGYRFQHPQLELALRQLLDS